jgi:hypothetical protein
MKAQLLATANELAESAADAIPPLKPRFKRLSEHFRRLAAACACADSLDRDEFWAIIQADKTAQRLYDAEADFYTRLIDALDKANAKSSWELPEDRLTGIQLGWEAAWPEYAGLETD